MTGHALAKTSPALPTLGALPGYAAMRAAVEAAASIDEAALLADQASALLHYARARRDTELSVWVAEIRVRASFRLGELIAGLEKSRALGHGHHRLPAGGRTKLAAIRSAGLSVGVAFVLEALAGGRDPAQQASARAAAEAYFQECRAQRRPASQTGLRLAVRGEAELMPPRPARRPRKPAADQAGPASPAPVAAPTAVAATLTPPADDLVRLCASIRFLARLAPSALPALASRAALQASDLRVDAEQAEQILSRWIACLCTVAPRIAQPEDSTSHRGYRLHRSESRSAAA